MLPHDGTHGHERCHSASFLANRPPTHPGALIQNTIEDMGITQVALAKRFGIPLERLNTIVKGKRPSTTVNSSRCHCGLQLP
jgi:hypothetical protein